MSAPQKTQNSQTSNGVFMSTPISYFEQEEDHILRPKVISETLTRLQKRQQQTIPTSTREISFRGNKISLLIKQLNLEKKRL